MGTVVKRLDFDCRRGEKAMAHTVFTVVPFHWEEEGVEGFVDLDSTKKALSLSREPNPSTEKQVLMGNSLSSTAIQPPQWKPQIMSRRESQPIMWGATFEIQCPEWSRMNQSGNLRLKLPPCILRLRSRVLQSDTVVGITEQRHYQPPFLETGPWLSSTQPVTLWLLEERLSIVDQESGQTQTHAEIQLFKVPRSVTLLYLPKLCIVTLAHMWTDLKAGGQVSR